MIFVTVGMQLPFDRLVRAMDRLAVSLSTEVFAQIGESEFRPANMEFARILDARAFEEKVAKAEVVVSHAGIGSILAAQRNAVPLVILPRKAMLGEHRTDHQLDTVNAINGRRGIVPVAHEGEIAAAIEQCKQIDCARITPAQASPELKIALKQFIDLEQEALPPRRLFGLLPR